MGLELFSFVEVEKVHRLFYVDIEQRALNGTTKKVLIPLTSVLLRILQRIHCLRNFKSPKVISNVEFLNHSLGAKRLEYLKF